MQHVKSYKYLDIKSDDYFILFKNQLIENQKEIKELKINLKNKLEEREKLKKLIKKVKIR